MGLGKGFLTLSFFTMGGNGLGSGFLTIGLGAGLGASGFLTTGFEVQVWGLLAWEVLVQFVWVYSLP